MLAKDKTSPKEPLQEFIRNSRSALTSDEGIVIVDPNLRPIALDSGAEAILDDLAQHRGNSWTGSDLPPEILRALDSRSVRQSETSSVRVNVGGGMYSCRTFRIKPRSGTEAMVVLHLKRESNIADMVNQVAIDYHLTDREREALLGISMGLSSKELATRMNISPNTVKAFLRLVMIKTGTTTRAGILGKLLGQRVVP